MTHQNRVTPFNELIATPARGNLMGNRGILHDDQGRIVRSFAHKNWVTCVLDFKGRHRQVMTPGRSAHHPSTFPLHQSGFGKDVRG